MEDLSLVRIAALVPLVPEFAVKDLPLGRTLLMMMILIYDLTRSIIGERRTVLDHFKE